MESFEYKDTTYYITDNGLESEFSLKRNKKQLTDLRAPNESEVAHCIAWLNQYASPRKTINKAIGSYGLKHIVENWETQIWSRYVSNGAFILAAFRLGFIIVPYDPHNPNAGLCANYEKDAIKTRYA